MSPPFRIPEDTREWRDRYTPPAPERPSGHRRSPVRSRSALRAAATRRTGTRDESTAEDVERLHAKSCARGSAQPHFPAVAPRRIRFSFRTTARVETTTAPARRECVCRCGRHGQIPMFFSVLPIGENNATKGLHREPFSTLCPPPSKDIPSPRRAGTGEESHLPFPRSVMRLKSLFHEHTSRM